TSVRSAARQRDWPRTASPTSRFSIWRTSGWRRYGGFASRISRPSSSPTTKATTSSTPPDRRRRSGWGGPTRSGTAPDWTDRRRMGPATSVRDCPEHNTTDKPHRDKQRTEDFDMAVSNEEQMMIDLVAEFVDEQVKPDVNRVEHANEYPEAGIQTMKDMGIYGPASNGPWGMSKVSTGAYAVITQYLARDWMSLDGAMGGNTVVAKLTQEYATQQQKHAYLQRMATGDQRATLALTEPGGGTDL